MRHWLRRRQCVLTPVYNINAPINHARKPVNHYFNKRLPLRARARSRPFTIPTFSIIRSPVLAEKDEGREVAAAASEERYTGFRIIEKSCPSPATHRHVRLSRKYDRKKNTFVAVVYVINPIPVRDLTLSLTTRIYRCVLCKRPISYGPTRD